MLAVCNHVHVQLNSGVCRMANFPKKLRPTTSIQKLIGAYVTNRYKLEDGLAIKSVPNFVFL